MQAELIFWYEYKKIELILIIQNTVETVWWKIVFEDDVQWNLIHRAFPQQYLLTVTAQGNPVACDYINLLQNNGGAA